MEDMVDSLMETKMMIRRIRMMPVIEIRTKEEIIPIISMIRTTKIREEEVEEKDL